MSRKIRLRLEVVDAQALAGRALPALEAASDRGDAGPLAAAALEAFERLRAKRPDGPSYDPDVQAWKLACARLEALALTNEPPATEAALEEVAWSLLRAARLVEPVELGEDWDALRVLLDPARRKGGGLGTIGGTLSAAALVGSGGLVTENGFAFARHASYATGWNSPERAAKIARALRRWTPERLAAAARSLSPEVARSVYPVRMSPFEKRLPRIESALEKLRSGYDAAAREGGGVFVELEID